MSDLLPPNVSRLERAIAGAAGEIEAVPVTVRNVWNPDTCPGHVLPWLAWAFSVDDWNESWTDTQKRDSIRMAIVVQRHKGTIGAVKDALGALGIDARVQEWFAQKSVGEPYTFKLWLESDQTALTAASIEHAVIIVESLKSLRSHLEQIRVRALSRNHARVAAATNLGSEVTVPNFKPRLLVPNELAIVVREA